MIQTLYDGDRFSLLHGESLEALRLLPDKSVDMICTDPPYSKHVHAKLGKEKRNDGVLPRKMLTFPSLDEARIKLFAAEYVRVCKGWILTFSDFYNSAFWGEGVQAAGGEWVRTGQWVKTNPMPQITGDRPACGGEDIVICHASARTADWEWNAHGHAAIWRGGRDPHQIHPNQKPEWLIQALLGQFAPANALVLDPFIGTGTTAVAAMRTTRVTGEMDPMTTCKACARKKVEEYAPPLPVGVRVLGIEGDIMVATGAVERVTGVCF